MSAKQLGKYVPALIFLDHGTFQPALSIKDTLFEGSYNTTWWYSQDLKASNEDSKHVGGSINGDTPNWMVSFMENPNLK